MTPEQAIAWIREQFESHDPVRGMHIGPRIVFVTAQEALGVLEKAVKPQPSKGKK